MAARQDTPNVHEIAMIAMGAIISNTYKTKLIEMYAKREGIDHEDVLAGVSYRIAEAMVAEGANH